MASILFIILIIIFVGVIVLLSIGTYILSALFGGFMNLRNFVCRIMGLGKQTNSAKSSANTSSQSSSGYTKSSGQSSASQSKMFGQDEGTYIDFEEVK